MANYRIEILFSGDAPDDELERARILGSTDVAEAVYALSKALEGHGFGHEVRAQTIRKNQRKASGERAAAQMRVAGGQAAE
jgi:hypothetical protein